jgi:hypothetical protein
MLGTLIYSSTVHPWLYLYRRASACPARIPLPQHTIQGRRLRARPSPPFHLQHIFLWIYLFILRPFVLRAWVGVGTGVESGSQVAQERIWDWESAARPIAKLVSGRIPPWFEVFFAQLYFPSPSTDDQHCLKSFFHLTRATPNIRWDNLFKLYSLKVLTILSNSCWSHSLNNGPWRISLFIEHDYEFDYKKFYIFTCE